MTSFRSKIESFAETEIFAKIKIFAEIRILADITILAATFSLCILGFPLPGHAHGDGAPQPVDTAGLPAMGEDWKGENPFRKVDAKLQETAIEVGSRGYNANCARCHGIEVVSGGIAPDIRFLEPNAEGDTWFLQRVRKGAVVNDRQKMPPFEGLLSQEAIWAIRTYIETRPQE